MSFQAKRAGKTRSLKIDREGNITGVALPESKVFAHGDKIYLRTGGATISVGSGDRFFSPKLSPDQSKIVFTGLATGVHVYDIASRRQTRVGPGTAPSWSPDSKSLAFERTEDDGHYIVGSDLWLWDSERGARALTHTSRRKERNPSWSPDGKQLAFDDDEGSIYLLAVGEQ